MILNKLKNFMKELKDLTPNPHVPLRLPPPPPRTTSLPTTNTKTPMPPVKQPGSKSKEAAPEHYITVGKNAVNDLLVDFIGISVTLFVCVMLLSDLGMKVLVHDLCIAVGILYWVCDRYEGWIK